MFPETFAFINNLAGPDLIVVLVIVMLLFGGKKMPELGRSLGQSIREFKKASAEFESELKRVSEDEKPALTAPKPVAETKPAAETKPVAETKPADDVKLVAGAKPAVDVKAASVLPAKESAQPGQ